MTERISDSMSYVHVIQLFLILDIDQIKFAHLHAEAFDFVEQRFDERI